MLADAIRWLIGASARNPWTTIAIVLAGAVAGWLALLRTPLDALPDLSDTQVVILTEWEGQSPDLVESQITTPISSALLGAPRVQFVRGQSMFGLSFVLHLVIFLVIVQTQLLPELHQEEPPATYVDMVTLPVASPQSGTPAPAPRQAPPEPAATGT
jgi:hypothetical protein